MTQTPEEKRESWRASSRKYRKANPEKEKEWRKANPEKKKAASKRWYKANPEKVAARCKRWQKANPEKKKAYAKAYYEANLEKVTANNKAWREANKERISVMKKAHPERNSSHEAMRRARKLGTEVKNCPRVKAMYFIAAWLRSKGDDVHVDHIIPLFRGGTHTHDNLQILTAEENMRKGSKMLVEAT